MTQLDISPCLVDILVGHLVMNIAFFVL